MTHYIFKEFIYKILLRSFVNKCNRNPFAGDAFDAAQKSVNIHSLAYHLKDLTLLVNNNCVLKRNAYKCSENICHSDRISEFE
jgi:hypothetical protein